MTSAEAERLLALSREADFLGPDAAGWVERLSPERGALEEAVRRFAGSGDAEKACELATNVWRLWFMTGDVDDGRALLATALAADGPASRSRVRALYADGVLAFREGNQSESKERNEAALADAQEIGDDEGRSLALVGLSRVALRDGDYGRVRALSAEARDLARPFGAGAEAMPLHLLAAGTRLDGELDAAVELYEESLELNRGCGDSMMVAMELHNLGHVEVRRGNLDAAKRHFAECTSLRSGQNPYDVAMSDLNTGALAVADGDRAAARELLSRAEQTLAEAGIVLDPDDQSEVDWLRERL